ncbi:MAG: T9SS type A sorting domain-containing protein [Bacteroidales bacterium]|nr:T9SS type A sorting domain-containing protein [Bacteroidales bacterium]
MRKNLFLALALLFSVAVFAQNNSFIINETFDSSEMPEGWYFMGEGADNFKINSTNNAGGDPNELFFKSSPIVTAGIRLVMGSADLTDVKELGLSFKHNLSNAQLSSTIGIATSSDNGTTWNTGWSRTYSEAASSGQYNINETIKTADMGKNNVLFCLFYEGNTYNFNKWYFDDICIFTLSDEGTDLQLSSINVDNIIQSGNIEIGFTVDNISRDEITSFEASYEIEGFDIVTETFNITVAPNQKVTATFKQAVELLPGTYEIKVNILSVNGEEDANLDNNTSSKEIRTFMKTVERTPMLEHFSSATCINCIPVDTTLLGLTHNNEGRYTYVKYPWNYPLPGDKYYLEDCMTRGEYYKVKGVPSITFDGTTTTRQPKQSNFDERYKVPSYMEIIGAFDVNDNTINVTTDIISYIDMPNVRVFATVNEKTTVENKVEGSLPEFHHVLMNMLSGAEGIEASFEAGKYQRYEFTLDMTTTNMEEINDLEVAVWIQNYESKEIYNSRFLQEYTSHPYPVQNLTAKGKNISWETPEQGNPTGYNVLVNNELVANNIAETSYTLTSSKDKNVIEVFALYNEKSSVSVSLFAENETEIEDDTTSIVEHNQLINIYPNPVNDRLYVETQTQTLTIEIYDVYGRLQDYKTTRLQGNVAIDVENLKSGIYFVKINTEKGNIVKRIIKQ